VSMRSATGNRVVYLTISLFSGLMYPRSITRGEDTAGTIGSRAGGTTRMEGLITANKRDDGRPLSMRQFCKPTPRTLPTKIDQLRHPGAVQGHKNIVASRLFGTVQITVNRTLSG
jgi:hypothetical protein